MKQKDIYINHYESIAEAKIGLAIFFNDYNSYRPHQFLNNKTPAEIYFGQNKETAFFQQFTNLHINSNIVTINQLFNDFKLFDKLDH